MNALFNINNKILETDRLILRAFKQSDLEDFFEYASVDGVGERAGWLHHKNIETTQSILDLFIKNDNVFAICDKQTGKVIGSIGVEEYKLEDKLSEFFDYRGRELGYVLSKNYWGKGIMCETVSAVINYLFEVYDLDFILCGYYNFNNQSKRVQEKCGFKPYRKLVFTTKYNTQEDGILSLLINPRKDIKFVFSHQETLIYNDY